MAIFNENHKQRGVWASRTALLRCAQIAVDELTPEHMRGYGSNPGGCCEGSVKDGIVFVDTPGIASLATSTAEAIASLPRCDLGIVLRNAASALASEDIALMDTLRRAGTAVMVLLGKADLLAPLEQVQAEIYLTEKLENMTSATAPVYLVSVRGRNAALCDRRFEKALLPQLRDHRRLGQMLLRCRLGMFRDATVSALGNALPVPGGPRNGGNARRRRNAFCVKRSRSLTMCAGGIPRMPHVLFIWWKKSSTKRRITPRSSRISIMSPGRTLPRCWWQSRNGRIDRAASATIRSLAKIRAELQNTPDAASSAAGVMPATRTNCLTQRVPPSLTCCHRFSDRPA